MNMNGTPSNRMLKNEIEKSCKLNVNQFITRDVEARGWTRREQPTAAVNATAAPA